MFSNFFFKCISIIIAAWEHCVAYSKCTWQRFPLPTSHLIHKFINRASDASETHCLVYRAMITYYIFFRMYDMVSRAKIFGKTEWHSQKNKKWDFPSEMRHPKVMRLSYDFFKQSKRHFGRVFRTAVGVLFTDPVKRVKNDRYFHE